MIDRNYELPLARQAALLRLSRSQLYYEPRPVPAAELAVMRRIDALHLDYPFAGSQAFRSALADANETPGSQAFRSALADANETPGSRMLRDLLRGEGVVIGRELVRTMMRRMCIEALYRRPSTSKPAPGHKI
jgi:putative transposase